MDSTNPGLVEVASQVYGNPDPNGGTRLLVPRQLDVLIPVGDEGYPPAGSQVTSYPIPAEVVPVGLLGVPVTPWSPVPPATNFNVDDQVLGQGVWLPVDPLNPAAGKKFVTPGEFIVVGPSESFQTNYSEATTVLCTVVAVYDADNLYHAPVPTTTRYMLVVGPPALTSYPVSMLGRQIVFADDTTTVADQGAARIVTGFSTNFLVIDKNDPNDEIVPILIDPVVGDTFTIDVQRLGSEQVNTTGAPTANVIIAPSPKVNVPYPSQAGQGGGTFNVSTGPQPGQPIITSGVRVPASETVNIADQASAVGLPRNVYV